MPIDIPYKLGTNGRCYYGHQTIDKADGASFEILNHVWARDKKTVYYYGRPLRTADRASFTVLNHLFAKDRELVFETDGVLKGADAATFEVLDGGYFEYDVRNGFGDIVHRHDQISGYARDKTFVYRKELTYKARVLKTVDRATFEVLKYGFGRDYRRVYYDGTQVKKADPATFEQVGYLWGRDRKRAFYLTSVIEGADPTSFAVVDEHNLLSRDRFFFYRWAKPVEPSEIVFDKDNRPLGWPLVSGLQFGLARVAQFLAAGALPSQEPQALQLACQYHDVAMAKLLLDHGADPNSCCEGFDKAPPLTYAIYNREPKAMVDLLLGAGADINAGGGRTPLEAALVGGKWDLAEYLVTRGADVNALAHTGQRLLDYAKWLTNASRMIKFLEDHGAL